MAAASARVTGSFGRNKPSAPLTMPRRAASSTYTLCVSPKLPNWTNGRPPSSGSPHAGSSGSGSSVDGAVSPSVPSTGVLVSGSALPSLSVGCSTSDGVSVSSSGVVLSGTDVPGLPFTPVPSGSPGAASVSAVLPLAAVSGFSTLSVCVLSPASEDAVLLTGVSPSVCDGSVSGLRVLSSASTDVVSSVGVSSSGLDGSTPSLGTVLSVLPLVSISLPLSVCSSPSGCAGVSGTACKAMPNCATRSSMVSCCSCAIRSTVSRASSPRVIGRV